MAAETTTLTLAELFAGAVSKRRSNVTVKSGQNLAAHTVVAYDADGKIVAHNGVITPTMTQSGTTPFAVTFTPATVLAGVLVAAVNATAGDTAGAIYEDGDFFMDLVVWPANIDGVAATTLTKKKLFAGTDLKATYTNTGEY